MRARRAAGALAGFILGAVLAAGLYRLHVARIDQGLIDATEAGDIGSMRRSLAAGADPNVWVPGRETKPTPATFFHNALHGELRIPRPPRTTLLTIAVMDAHLDEAALLLKSGARVDTPDEYGFTALTSAITGGRLAVVELLLRHGANPNAPNQLHMPPLIWAIMLRQTPCALALLKFGANANAMDGDGIPALYLAVLEREERLTSELLARGADPNTQYRGWPVLRLALSERDSRLVWMLALSGAAPARRAVRNSSGHSPAG